MKTLIQYASLAVVTTATFCGRGPGSPKVSSADVKAFDNASQQLKDLWQQSQSATSTNDYVQAILALRSLMPLNLTRDQRTAVETAMNACDAKMMKAVEHGDPAAQKALEILRSTDALVAAFRFRKRRVLLLAVFCFLLFGAVGVAAYFRPGTDTKVLRIALMSSLGGAWDRRLELHLGPIALGALRTASRWANLAP